MVQVVTASPLKVLSHRDADRLQFKDQVDKIHNGVSLIGKG